MLVREIVTWEMGNSGHTGRTPNKKAVCENSSAYLEKGPWVSYPDPRGGLLISQIGMTKTSLLTQRFAVKSKYVT